MLPPNKETIINIGISVMQKKHCAGPLEKVCLSKPALDHVPLDAIERSQKEEACLQ